MYTKQLAGRITAASLRALQNNPGSPAGFKKRRCAKSEQETVSNETVQVMKDLADNESADFRDAMVSFQKSFSCYNSKNRFLKIFSGCYERTHH